MTRRKHSLIGVTLEDIFKEYDEKCDVIEEFTSVTEKLIKDLLKSANLRVHSVTSRIKTKESIKGKFNKASEENRYQYLYDITDLSGIRIITFFPDEVDSVATLINKEFTIDPNLSVDKRTLLDPDRFGYLSLHYIAKLSRSRQRLAEYSRFKNCQTEIQIRSILQHTWAEIEHDLGYKTKLSVPKDIRRRFSQLAGLLELADDTFSQIRDDLEHYESNISAQIKEFPEAVHIDKASLLAFIEASTLVNQIDMSIVEKTPFNLSTEISDSCIIDYIQGFNYLNINTIAELNNILKSKKELVIKLAFNYLSSRFSNIKDKPAGSLIRTVSLLYLIYLLILEKSTSVKSLRQALKAIGKETSAEEDTATMLMTAFKTIKPT